MYSGGFSFSFSFDCSCSGPATNSPLQPSDTQIPVSSYPHVFPSRHGAVPVDFSSATPLDVSAAQCCRSPGRDWQDMRFCPVPAGAAAALGALGVCGSVAAAAATGCGGWPSDCSDCAFALDIASNEHKAAPHNRCAPGGAALIGVSAPRYARGRFEHTLYPP